MIINLCGYKVLIDDEDYNNIIKYKWSPSRRQSSPSGLAYFLSNQYDINGNRMTVPLHRFIMKYTKGDGKTVDHISGDILDCRKGNLRICTHGENLMNSGKSKNNTSGYKGVTQHICGNRWQAQIQIDNKPKYLGLYETPEQAAIEYNKAAIKYHGEFARLNIVL